MADRQSDTQPLRSCRRSTLSSDVPEEEEEASIPTTAADILGRRPNGFLGLSLDDRTILVGKRNRIVAETPKPKQVPPKKPKF